jgi:hypothetical protein
VSERMNTAPATMSFRRFLGIEREMLDHRGRGYRWGRQRGREER